MGGAGAAWPAGQMNFTKGELVTEGRGVEEPVSTAIVEARFFDMVCRKVGDGADRLGKIYGGQIEAAGRNRGHGTRVV